MCSPHTLLNNLGLCQRVLVTTASPVPALAVAVGVPRVLGKGAAPTLLGQRLGWSEGVETSIVFPPVRVTKGQMDFHEMLLKNEKGLASGPRPRVPNPPQAEFYD